GDYGDRVSSNADKIMGLYPKKGAIAVGSDADITILEPGRRGKVRAADLHETDYTPWEGHDIFAWPVATILRGKVMVQNGQYLASPQDGRYLKRKIAQNIRDGAALWARRPSTSPASSWCKASRPGAWPALSSARAMAQSSSAQLARISGSTPRHRIRCFGG